MTEERSKKLLRIITGFLTLIPLARGGAEIICGAPLLNDGVAVAQVLSSEFRFLAGLFFTTGLWLIWLTPQMGNPEATPYVKVICYGYFFGGAMRLITLFQTGELFPPFWMLGLATELIVIPLLLRWHLRLAAKS